MCRNFNSTTQVTRYYTRPISIHTTYLTTLTLALRLCDVDWSFTHNVKRRDTSTHVTHWALILVHVWRGLAWWQSFPRILYLMSQHWPWSYDLNVCCCTFPFEHFINMEPSFNKTSSQSLSKVFSLRLS